MWPSARFRRCANVPGLSLLDIQKSLKNCRTTSRRRAAAKPLPVHLRAAFLQEVASLLAGCEPGPGTMHRAIAAVQRKFFDPPEPSGRLRRDD